MKWAYGDQAVWHVDDETGVVYVAEAHTGELVVLDGSAAVIWSVLPDATTDEIIESIADAAAVPVEEVRSDIEGFLESLAARGLARRYTS